MNSPAGASIRSWFKSLTAVVGATALLLGGGVSAEGIVTPQNAPTSAPGLGGSSSIEGNVTDSDWNGLEGVNVAAFDDAFAQISDTVTDSEGYYVINGLTEGDYTLCFDSADYDYVCLGDAPDVESAQFFWLGDGESYSDDYTLRKFGIVSGLVTDSHGDAVESAVVRFFKTQWGELWNSATATTDVDGLYSVNLEEGSYKVVAYVDDDESPLAPQWWNGVSSSSLASRVTVSSESPLQDIDFQLREGSTVGINAWCNSTGNECSAAPNVELFPLDGTFADESKQLNGHQVVFNGVPAGRYKIQINNSWWGGDGSEESAGILTVREGEDVRGLTYVFPENPNGATVSGYVLDKNGDPAVDYDVTIFDTSWGENDATTDADGYYEFAGVNPGTYSLSFETPSNCDDEGNCENSVTEYWGSVFSVHRSEFFDLSADDDFTGDFRMSQRTSRITGTVRNAAGTALSGVEVQISGPNGEGSATTTSNGRYTVSNLAPGVYRARASKEGFLSPYAVQYGNSGPSATVALGATGTINISLTPATAQISGRVTGSDAPTVGLPEMNVIVYRKSDGCLISWAQTDANGYYSFTGLAAGSYYVWAGTQAGGNCGWHGDGFGPQNSVYVGEYLTDKPNQATANVTSLTVGQNLTNQNFVLQRGASISGSVTLVGGSQGFSGISAKAYGPNNELIGFGSVGADGAFTINGLPAGVYFVKADADDSSRSPAWWADRSGSRRAVSVTGSQAVANVQIELEAIGIVRGSLRSQNGTAVSGRIEALDVNGVVLASTVASSADNSAYTLKLPAGVSVRLRAMVTGQEFWLGGATSMTTSPWVTSNSAAPLTVRDIVTTEPSQISGRLTEAGIAVGGYIELLDTAGKSLAQANVSRGEYTFTGVMPGTYTLLAHANTDAVVFYGNKETLATATFITASNGALLEGINIDLTPPTVIFLPGTIALTGVPKVGTSMTASIGTWTPVPTLISYRWSVEDSEFGYGSSQVVGTAASYTITAADLGKRLALSILVSKSGYISDRMYIQVGLVSGIAITASPVPTITGGTSAKVGTALKAVPGTWTPAPVTISYQWMKAGEPIPGATSATYTPTAADAGARLTVRTLGTKAGYVTVLKESVQTAAVALQTLTASPIPTITGTARVGSILTANTGAWTPAPVGIAFQWKRAGINIPGATGPTYLLSAEDQGRTITVSAVGSKVGFTPVTKTSVATASVAAPPAATLTATPTPTISGTAQIDNELTVTTGVWAPDPVALSIQWLRNGVAIPGANSTTYTPGSADVGKTIRVSVKGTKATFASVTKLSAATAVIAAGEIDISNAEGIFGDAGGEIGQVLTVELSGMAPADVTVRYQWLRDGEPIRGARRATYVPTARDFGREISVKFELSKPGYTTTYFTVDGYVVAYY